MIDAAFEPLSICKTIYIVDFLKLLRNDLDTLNKIT